MTIHACQAHKYTVAEIAIHTSGMDTLGRRIRAARAAKGLTQDEMADELEITKSTVSAWENDRIAPQLEKLPRLRELLGVSLDALVCGASSLAAWEKPLGVREPVHPWAKLTPAESTAPDQDEVRLLRFFRAMSNGRRKALLTLLRPTSSASENDESGDS